MRYLGAVVAGMVGAAAGVVRHRIMRSIPTGTLSARRLRIPDEHLPTSQFSPELLFDVDRDELPQHLPLGRN
jgi:hypothetical protein